MPVLSLSSPMKETGKFFPFPVLLTKFVLTPHNLIFKRTLFYNKLRGFFGAKGLAEWFGMVFATNLTTMS